MPENGGRRRGAGDDMKHRGRLVRLVFAGVVLVVLATATAGYVQSQTGDAVKAPIHDPDVDLPFAERDAKYQADWNEFKQRLAAWMAAFDPESVDLQSLEHAENWALTDGSSQSLDEAVAAADRIVVGRAGKLRPDGSNMFGTAVTFDVERTFKGKRESPVTVDQGSTFYPTADWSGVLIVDSPGEPLMFPGHRYCCCYSMARGLASRCSCLAGGTSCGTVRCVRSRGTSFAAKWTGCSSGTSCTWWRIRLGGLRGGRASSPPRPVGEHEEGGPEPASSLILETRGGA